jgi:Domain of unknown function (DUF4124)
MQINKLLTISLLTLTPILAQAAIYKWVDDQGNVQYSSEKPQDAAAEKIRVTTQPPVDSSTYRNAGHNEAKAEGDTKANAKDKDKDDKIKTPAEQRKEAAKKAESDKLKKEMCEEARQNLAAIENSARVRIEDDKGEVRYMEENEVASRKKSEQERVNKYCK